MKRLTIFLLLLLLLVGCTPKSTVVDLGGKPVEFESFEAMDEASSLIVHCKVLSTDTRINQVGGQVMSVLTVSQVVVQKVFKGDVQPGDIITVWQDSAYDAENNTYYLFANAYPLRDGKIYELYLRPRETGSQYYVPVSCQGILIAPGN